MSDTSPLSRLWGLLSLYKEYIIQIYTYAIIIGIVNLSLPLGIQSIINYIQTGEVTFSWGVLVGFVLLGIFITGVLQVLQMRIVESVQQDIYVRSALEFAYRIPKMKVLKLDNVHIPELVNRFFDTMSIQKGIPKLLIDFSQAIFQIFFGIVLLAFYSPYFILIGIILVIAVWIIIKLSGQRGLDQSLKESKYKYETAFWLEEIARTNKTFKRSIEDNFHLDKIDKISSKYVQERESHFQVLINQFKQFIGLKIFLAAALLIVGSLLVLNQQMNIGQFVASEILIVLIINSIEKIIRVIEDIYDLLTGLDKVGVVTDAELDGDLGSNELRERGPVAVELNNVSFSYPGGGKPVLNDISIRVNAGDIALLAGNSGSGRTTLLRLIGGIYEMQNGELLINDIPYVNYSSASTTRSIRFFHSTNELFYGTIDENLTLGVDVNKEWSNHLIKKLKLNHFIASQKKGSEAVIDPSGRRIPKHITEKMLLARTVITKPKLLLLDDPLSHLDKTEKLRIFEWLTSVEEWTIIVRSDSDFWKQHANQIINL